METPELHVINKIHWQFFGTLTFKRDRMVERWRLGMWFALLRLTAKQFEIPFPKLLWVLRQEKGEQFGRIHFHYLLALTKLEKLQALLKPSARLFPRPNSPGGNHIKNPRALKRQSPCKNYWPWSKNA